MTAITRSVLFPTAPARPTKLVDPVAFFLALILAPLVVGLLGAVFIFIPVFAILVGGLPYLVIGAPLLWRAVRHGMTEGDAFFALGFKTICWLSLPAFGFGAAALWSDGQGIEEFANGAWVLGLFALLCAVHAGFWAMAFGDLYARLRNPNFPT